MIDTFLRNRQLVKVREELAIRCLGNTEKYATNKQYLENYIRFNFKLITDAIKFLI